MVYNCTLPSCMWHMLAKYIGSYNSINFVWKSLASIATAIKRRFESFSLGNILFEGASEAFVHAIGQHIYSALSRRIYLLDTIQLILSLVAQKSHFIWIDTHTITAAGRRFIFSTGS